MSFKLPPLPYERDALEPYITKETIDYHYGKHHAAYVTKLNELVSSRPEISHLSFEEIIKTQKGKIFNMAAQVYNHTFYWNCLSPKGGGEPKYTLMKAIERSFGSFKEFKKKFSEEVMNHFGSGWVWLVRDAKNNLSIISTHDAGNPLTQRLEPLLTCDTWEHAFYIDYRNDKAKYVEAFWKIVNWDFVARQLALPSKL